MRFDRPPLLVSLIAVYLFGLAILYLGGTGKLNIYIHPSSQWFVLLTGFAFVFFGIYDLFRKELPVFSSNGALGIFSLLIVALLILSIKPVPLSVETARTRIANGANPVSTKNAERFTTRKTSDFGIVDWLAAFADPEKSFRYENTPADISGFLIVQDSQPMIGRLVITCCGADAQPATVRFRWSGELPEENTWIRVRGTMHAVDTIPVLEATDLEIIPEPKNPYAE